MTKKKILILSPRFPYPVIGGDRLRIFELCRELAKHYNLTLLSLCETENELRIATPNDNVFTRIERILLPKWRSRLNVLAALPTSTPLQIAYYKSTQFSRRIEELLKEHDCCVAHLIRTGEYVRNASIPTVLEMTDAISMNYIRVSELGKIQGIRSLIYRVEANRLLRYERRILDDFALVTLVSELDRDFLLDGRKRDNVLACSNGVNLADLPFLDRKVSAPVGVFIGNMFSLQNMDACMYFAEEILPKIRAKVEFGFRVVGRIKSGDARRLRTFEGIEVCQNVPNIADAVGDARVGLAPIRLGAGVQNKVLEYMALGLPVITSPIALEGLHALPDTDILVASTPNDYVNAVDQLWKSPNLRTSLAINGLQYVKSHHAWTSRLEPLVRSLRHILDDNASDQLEA